MAERHVQKNLAETKDLQKLRAVPVRRLRKYVGGLTWMMVIIPWFRAWLAPLWGAIASAAHWRGPPEMATVSQRQIAHSLVWLAAFLAGQKGSILRTIPVHPARHEGTGQLVCDASPWGLGAVFILDGVPIAWLADALTELDHLILGTEAGSPNGQATFEALAVLVAARTWLNLWRDIPLTIIMQSDSVAALGAAAKAGSGVGTMNTVIREMSLDLAEAAYEVHFYGHVPGRLNVWADALSRLAEPSSGKTIPKELYNVDRTDVAIRDQGWWRTAGPPSS